jgi:GntR family histidine utilization transcriptional repressor
MNAPAYQGIKDFILARIHAGEWSEGDQVPSENELAREFGVARMTVNRALRELTGEQVLTRVQGSGTFIARPKYESTLVAIRSISDEIAARGHRHHANVLHIGVGNGSADMQDIRMVSMPTKRLRTKCRSMLVARYFIRAYCTLKTTSRYNWKNVG